jgi:hypothetical protein
MKFERGQFFAGCVAIALAACSSSPVPGGPIVRGPSAMKPQPTTQMPVAGAGDSFDSDNPFGPAKITPMMTGTAGSGLKDGQCARQDVTTMRIVPTIWLVLDGSGSMVDMLGDKSRFDALKESLMDPTNGVVKSLEHDVKWGMVMYDGPVPGNFPTILPDGGTAMFSSGPAMTCPRLVTVEPKKDNYMDISAMYPPDPLGGSTPTDKALQAVISHLPNGGQGPVLDGMISPTIVVLATDGAPNDFCSMAFPPVDVQPLVIDAVKMLTGVGIKTYVISLAGDDMMLTQHLINVAQAGNTGKAPFIPMNKDQLVQTFKDIIGPGVACDVVLTGKVKPGLECMGTLQINAKTLTCNTDWKLKDSSTITIMGDACTQYKNDMAAVLHADFPCEVLTLN